jgi:hypothetical protein
MPLSEIPFFGSCEAIFEVTPYRGGALLHSLTFQERPVEGTILFQNGLADSLRSLNSLTCGLQFLEGIVVLLNPLTPHPA